MERCRIAIPRVLTGAITHANQAALVIYEELYKQFDQMVKKRDEVIERIDKQFEMARSYYSQTDIDGLFDEPASQELQPNA